MSEEGESGFKVKDKRRFDDSGNRKETDVPASDTGESVSAAASENSAQEEFVMKDSGRTEDEGSAPIDYGSFVLSLATQAMVQLGEMPSPPGVDIPKNPEAAKHTIDVVEMLQLKTKGNLTEPEEKLTEEILHNLRLAYVKNK